MHDGNLLPKLRTFCCRVIIPLLLADFETFRYYLRRKKVNISEESAHIWLKDKTNSIMDEEFSKMRQKQLKKKANLLKVTLSKKRSSASQEEENNEEL